MYGQVALRYTGGKSGKHEDNTETGFLGHVLGEELLFYEDPLYRETAVCITPHCCALRI